jgi:hypothetical protein
MAIVQGAACFFLVAALAPSPATAVVLYTPPAVVATGLAVADNSNNSLWGFDRVITVTSPGQFRISFSGELQACGDNIVDLVNDPAVTNPLNPAPPSYEGDPGSSPTSYVWRTCLAPELDSGQAFSHNGYMDANLGTTINREMEQYQNKTYLSSLGLQVNSSIVEQSAVRVVIRTKAFWTGYGGKGPDPKLDGNHSNVKEFTIYRDGQIYVRAVDTISAVDEKGPTTSRSTFIHPINARSTTGFTLGTNYSLDSYSMYPRGGGLSPWYLQWGQDTNPDPLTGVNCTTDCSKMNFLQVPEDLTCSVAEGGKMTRTYFQPMQQYKPSMNAGYRWGASPDSLTFPAGTSYAKNYLYQLGTKGSTLMPNMVTMKAANAVAAAYLSPATIDTHAGAFDRARGCYHIQIGSAVSTLAAATPTTGTVHGDFASEPRPHVPSGDVAAVGVSFSMAALVTLRNPAFCVDGAHSQLTRVTVDEIELPPASFATAQVNSTFALVQLLQIVSAGHHEISFS